jgi:hypothetical protein
MNKTSYKFQNGYILELDLLIISHYLHVSSSTISGCNAKSVCLRPLTPQVIAYQSNEQGK